MSALYLLKIAKEKDQASKHNITPGQAATIAAAAGLVGAGGMYLHNKNAYEKVNNKLTQAKRIISKLWDRRNGTSKSNSNSVAATIHIDDDELANIIGRVFEKKFSKFNKTMTSEESIKL